jgi:hypothetical protein
MALAFINPTTADKANLEGSGGFSAQNFNFFLFGKNDS